MLLTILGSQVYLQYVTMRNIHIVLLDKLNKPQLNFAYVARIKYR